MALGLYYASGSPFAWRAWLALEHKGVPYDIKVLSFDKEDLLKPEYLAVNPRHRVPAIVDDGFALYESAAIVEYLEDRFPGEPHLFSPDLRQRALQRRMIREADAYFAPLMQQLARAVLFTAPKDWSEERISGLCADMRKELSMWEPALTGDFLAGALSAADFTLYPQVALVQRMAGRKPDLNLADLIGPRMTTWASRMRALPVTQKTWPPHWK